MIMTLRSYGPRHYAVPEYTDEEAIGKSTQELLRSRCVFQTEHDGNVVGITGGARELIRRSDAYVAAQTYLHHTEAVHEARDATKQ